MADRHTVDTITSDALDALYARLEQAEDLLRIAHDTSNRSETERARAVQRAERAEAAITRVHDAIAPYSWPHAQVPAAKVRAALDEPQEPTT